MGTIDTYLRKWLKKLKNQLKAKNQISGSRSAKWSWPASFRTGVGACRLNEARLARAPSQAWTQCRDQGSHGVLAWIAV